MDIRSGTRQMVALFRESERKRGLKAVIPKRN
jgi:hypothetical protein